MSHLKTDDDTELSTPAAMKSLELEKLDTDLYRSTALWNIPPSNVAYGGQVVAQSLSAACETIGDNLVVHSLHSYFLRPGSTEIPVIYRVSRSRDGRSFASRTVIAMQKGVPIVTLQVSFHNEKDEMPCHLNYQPSYPLNVKHHSELKTSVGIVGTGHDATLVILRPDSKRSQKEPPIEVKPVDGAVLMRKKASPSREVMFWVRATSNIGDDENSHRSLAAYISDLSLIFSSYSHEPRLKIDMATSLDHSMWFHRTFRMDEWMLYHCQALVGSYNRVLCEGTFWTEGGDCAVTVVQQGLVRAHL